MFNLFSENDQQFIRLALVEAKRAIRLGEVPIGAVVVDEVGRILAAEHNRSILACDPTAHAEILALRTAAAVVGNYRLGEVTLYVTLEPCFMCAGALVWARVKRVVFGAVDLKTGALGSVLNLSKQEGVNYSPLVQGGLLAQESMDLLKNFFS